MKNLLFIVVIVTLFSCGKSSRQQGNFFETEVSYKDNKLGSGAFGIHKDSLFIFTDIMFGNQLDTFLITELKDNEFITKTPQGIEINFSYTKVDNEISTIKYKDLEFLISKKETLSPLEYYSNIEVSTNPLNYLLFGTYKGTLHSKLSLAAQVYASIDYKVKFNSGSNDVELKIIAVIDGLTSGLSSFEGMYYMEDDHLIIKKNDKDDKGLKFLVYDNWSKLDLDEDYLEGNLIKSN